MPSPIASFVCRNCSIWCRSPARTCTAWRSGASSPAGLNLSHRRRIAWRENEILRWYCERT